MPLPININDLLHGKAVEFEFDEDHSYFMVRLRVQPDAQQVALPVDKARPKSRLESRLESGLESATSRKVLATLFDGELGRLAIAQALGHQRVSGAVNRAIKELLAAGLIEQTIPEKPNSRLQKYRLLSGKRIP